MGAVWVADHLALHTQVVVKFIAAGLKGSREAEERFSREAAAAAQVKSPHVVQTFDHGLTPSGVPYIVMELLEGRDLGAYLEDHGRCEPAFVLQIVSQLARALERAHDRGIVHRDIKPGNIFLCDHGGGDVFVKLLDFGIAKGVELPQIDSTTKTGSMIGSPFYMSPEQILGLKGIDFRSDLWSVGVVAYEALTGNKPFDAETMGGLAIKIHSMPLPHPSEVNRTLPIALDAWFERACARNVDDRFTSARDLAEAFAAALGGEMPRSFSSPRVSTGPRVSGHAPTLAAGASTDSGIEARPREGGQTRNRLFATLGIAAVVGLGAFGIVSALRHDGRAGVTSDRDAHASNAPASASLVPASALVSANLTAPPSPSTPGSGALAASASAAPGAEPIPAASAGPAPHAKPTGRPTSRPKVPPTPPVTAASSPTPSPTPSPSPTGHDIF